MNTSYGGAEKLALDAQVGELAATNDRRRDRGLNLAGYAALAALIVVAVLWLSGDQSRQYTSVIAATTAIAALGFFVVYQVGGVTFAQAGLMAVGAYTSGLLSLKFDFPPLLAMVVGILASVVVGVGVGVLITRARSGFHFILVTFAFSEVVRLFLEKWVYGSDGVPNIPSPTVFGFAFDTPQRYFWLALGALGLCVAAVGWIMHSELGRMFHIVRDGEAHMSPSFGVRASTYKLLAFGIASALAGLAGGLQAHFLNFIAPEQFDLHFSVLVLTASVMGGAAFVLGPVVGAFSLAFLNEALSDYPGLNVVIYGAVLIIVMLFLPEGIVGTIRSAMAFVRSSVIRRIGTGRSS